MSHPSRRVGHMSKDTDRYLTKDIHKEDPRDEVIAAALAALGEAEVAFTEVCAGPEARCPDLQPGVKRTAA